MLNLFAEYCSTEIRYHAMLLLYDITDENHFELCSQLVSNYLSKMTVLPQVYVAGNKADQNYFRAVPMCAGRSLANEFGASFCEISVEHPSSVNGLMHMLAENLRDQVRRAFEMLENHPEELQQVRHELLS